MIELPPKLKKREIDNAFSVLNNEKYASLLQKIDEEYLYWDKVKHIISDVDSDSLWHATKIIRSINSKKNPIRKIHFSIPHYGQNARIIASVRHEFWRKHSIGINYTSGK